MAYGAVAPTDGTDSQGTAAATRAEYLAAIQKAYSPLKDIAPGKYQEAQDQAMAAYDQGKVSPQEIQSKIGQYAPAPINGKADQTGVSQTANNFFYGGDPNAYQADVDRYRHMADMIRAQPGYQSVDYANGDDTTLLGQTRGQLTAGAGLGEQQNALGIYQQLAQGGGLPGDADQDQYKWQYLQAIDKAQRAAASTAASAQGSGLQRGAANLAAVNQAAAMGQAGAAQVAAQQAGANYDLQMQGLAGYTQAANALTQSGNSVASLNAGIANQESNLAQQNQLNAANIRNQQAATAMGYEQLGQGVMSAAQQGGQSYEQALLQKYGVSTGQATALAQIASNQKIADDAAKRQIVGGVLATGGAVAGAVVGGPAGAAIGGSAGNSLGNAISSEKPTLYAGGDTSTNSPAAPSSSYVDAIRTDDPTKKRDGSLPAYA